MGDWLGVGPGTGKPLGITCRAPDEKKGRAGLPQRALKADNAGFANQKIQKEANQIYILLLISDGL